MSGFWAHAISRAGERAAGGIHLLWTAPDVAGYSIDGFDVWRRERRARPGYECYELTAGDLAALSRLQRAETPLALVGLHLGRYPRPPPAIPDARPRPTRRWATLLRDDRATAAGTLLAATTAHDPVVHALSAGGRPAPTHDAPEATAPQLTPAPIGFAPSPAWCTASRRASGRS